MIATPCRVSHHGRVESPDHILLRLRLLRWRIFLDGCLGRSGRSRVGFGLALILVCLSAFGSLLRQRTGLLLLVEHHPVAGCLVPSLLAVLTGMVCGRHAVQGACRDLEAPWLAVLPWSDHARKRALLLCCLPPFGLALLVASAAALMIGVLLRPMAMPLLMLTGAMLVGSGFVCGLAVMPARRRRTGHAAGGTVHRSTPLDRADQGKPRWLGCWALQGRGRWLVRLWIGSVASLGVLGVAGSIETGTGAPAAMTGVVGGHLMFLAALRARPLRADALRLLPASFRHAVWGVVRLPLLLSLGWFVLPAATAFAAAPGADAPAGGLAGLLLLDALAGLSSLWLADAPAAALLLHGAVLLFGLQYWARLGLGELVPLFCLAILLWRGARRRFVEGIDRNASRHS